MQTCPGGHSLVPGSPQPQVSRARGQRKPERHGRVRNQRNHCFCRASSRTDPPAFMPTHPSTLTLLLGSAIHCIGRAHSRRCTGRADENFASCRRCQARRRAQTRTAPTASYPVTDDVRTRRHTPNRQQKTVSPAASL
jgi:hypothetical protein